MQIKCSVTPLSRKYANGLEQVELYVCSESISSVAMPGAGQRVPITVVTPQGKYLGGLRDNQGRGWPYICPDLYLDGRKVSLARILKDNGISPGDTISVRVSGQTWQIA
jgi:hypothetical protein